MLGNKERERERKKEKQLIECFRRPRASLTLVFPFLYSFQRDSCAPTVLKRFISPALMLERDSSEVCLERDTHAGICVQLSADVPATSLKE